MCAALRQSSATVRSVRIKFSTEYSRSLSLKDRLGVRVTTATSRAHADLQHFLSNYRNTADGDAEVSDILCSIGSRKFR